jgi:hypothetical protein
MPTPMHCCTCQFGPTAAARSKWLPGYVRLAASPGMLAPGSEFEGGHDLSVGQWQRFALARAFLRNAPASAIPAGPGPCDRMASFNAAARLRHGARDRQRSSRSVQLHVTVECIEGPFPVKAGVVSTNGSCATLQCASWVPRGCRAKRRHRARALESVEVQATARDAAISSPQPKSIMTWGSVSAGGSLGTGAVMSYVTP